MPVPLRLIVDVVSDLDDDSGQLLAQFSHHLPVSLRLMSLLDLQQCIEGKDVPGLRPIRLLACRFGPSFRGVTVEDVPETLAHLGYAAVSGTQMITFMNGDTTVLAPLRLPVVWRALNLFVGAVALHLTIHIDHAWTVFFRDNLRGIRHRELANRNR